MARLPIKSWSIQGCLYRLRNAWWNRWQRTARTKLRIVFNILIVLRIHSMRVCSDNLARINMSTFLTIISEISGLVESQVCKEDSKPVEDKLKRLVSYVTADVQR